MAGITEDDIRQMIALLERYRSQMDMLAQQLGMLQSSEAELGAASDLLSRYGTLKEGDDVLVPVGGGVHVAARLANAEALLVAVGSGVHVEMPPPKAAERIQGRRDRVREMIQQTRATMEQINSSADALSAQIETAYQQLEGKPIQ
jgi:prefoldin alpha subunit